MAAVDIGAVREFVSRTRREQGLPAQIEDLAALQSVADLLERQVPGGKAAQAPDPGTVTSDPPHRIQTVNRYGLPTTASRQDIDMIEDGLHDRLLTAKAKARPLTA